MTTPVWSEGALSFSFPGAISVERLDDLKLQGMKLVDFVIEEDRRALLIEIKDPFPDVIPDYLLNSKKEEEIKKLQTNELINEHLVPKARDSYCYLHLMNRDDKPFYFIFLTGAERLGINKELLLNFRDRLHARLRKETDKEWNRQYVRNCVVLTEDGWNETLNPYKVVRN